MQAITQAWRAFSPSALGEFVVMALKILTRTRKRVISKAILPCKVYIGSSTKIVSQKPNMPECHQKEWERKPNWRQQKASWASSRWSCSEPPSWNGQRNYMRPANISVFQPVQNHLKTCHTVVASLGWKVECVLHLEAGNLHLVIQDTLCGVGHEREIVSPVNHLCVVVIEWPNLSREVWRDLYTWLLLNIISFLMYCICILQRISGGWKFFVDLKLASLCIHWELVKIHRTHEPDTSGNHIQHFSFFRHP